MLHWILFAVLGRLLIFLWMKLVLPERLEKINFISTLHECSLCSGVWLYTALAFFMKVDVLTSWFGFQHIEIISQIITGAVTSFLVWIFVNGWNESFNTMIVIDDD